MEDTKLRRAEKWSGSHRGIGFQISRHIVDGLAGPPDYPVWCYYLFLSEKQVPDAKLDGFFLPPIVKPPVASGNGYVTYDYYNSAWANLDSWHCGITYYDYEQAVPGHRVVKVGCDWDHLWDKAEHDPYSLDGVAYECRATVDELCEQHPDLLVHCGWMGSYHPADEMVPWGKGYISAEGARKRDESKSKT